MSSHDEVLEYLVKILEETDLGISVTLCVNGSVIAGQMISSKRYFEEISSIYSQKGNITTDDASLIERGLPAMERITQFLQQKGKSKEEQNSPKYIHLEKVVIYPSNPSRPTSAIVWRGKLSSIDGFSIGHANLDFRYQEEESEVEDAELD